MQGSWCGQYDKSPMERLPSSLGIFNSAETHLIKLNDISAAEAGVRWQIKSAKFFLGITAPTVSEWQFALTYC